MSSPTTSKEAPQSTGNDLSSLAQFILSDKCKRITLMLGAGVSTSAGIPDFRSPKTGLYANLARLNLPYPEAVFEINFFRRNPMPFYALAHELYPGKFRPTVTHSFVRLLSEHGLLKRCFTQNIDTLERRAGVPDDLVIEAHGSFASQRCIECKHPYDGDRIKKRIRAKLVARCGKIGCNGLVKPDIVFFGESLPAEFVNNIHEANDTDLLIVMGTSLAVQPFASLAGLPSPQTRRVLINMDRVGDLGRRPNDIVLLGKCDDVVRDLAKELGWAEELEGLWEKTVDAIDPPSPVLGPDPAEPPFWLDEDDDDDGLYGTPEEEDDDDFHYTEEEITGKKPEAETKVNEIVDKIVDSLKIEDKSESREEETIQGTTDSREEATPLKEEGANVQEVVTALPQSSA